MAMSAPTAAFHPALVSTEAEAEHLGLCTFFVTLMVCCYSDVISIQFHTRHHTYTHLYAIFSLFTYTLI